MPLTWTQQLATGVRQIDLQHQELIDIINELEAASTAGNKLAAIEEVLPRLAAYVLFHFGTEEAMLSNLSQEHAKAHQQMHRLQHAVFTERVHQLCAQPLAEVDLDAFNLYLQSWLLAHILKTDRELGRLLLDESMMGAGR